MVKNLPAMPPAMHDTQVQSLVREDPLAKEMAIHSNILSWEIPWTEEPGRLQSMGVSKSQTQLKQLSTHAHIVLLYSCIC